MLEAFHTLLPHDIKNIILRIWFTNYYRIFCQCGTKKEKIYKYHYNKFYRECSGCGRRNYCNDITYEMRYLAIY